MEKFVSFKKGDVVVFQFPFVDLKQSKKRPSLVVANVKGDNLILAQITGQPRPDPDILKLKSKDFKLGGINRDSFIRPSILFTIHKSRIDYKAGELRQEKIKQVEKQLIKIFIR